MEYIRTIDVQKLQILSLFIIISGVARVHTSAQPQFLLPKEIRAGSATMAELSNKVNKI